jgi:hypothetical protein
MARTCYSLTPNQMIARHLGDMAAPRLSWREAVVFGERPVEGGVGFVAGTSSAEGMVSPSGSGVTGGDVDVAVDGRGDSG